MLVKALEFKRDINEKHMAALLWTVEIELLFFIFKQYCNINICFQYFKLPRVFILCHCHISGVQC